MWNDVERQNQWLEREPSTKMACGSYGIGHSVNVMNDIEVSDEYIQCHELWYSFLDAYRLKYIREKGIDPIIHGSWLQDQLDLARRLKYIAWYWTVETVEEMRSALTSWQIIYTWSAKIDRKKTKINNEVVVGKGFGHAFCIDWYNETHLRCRNSYGNEYMDSWRFRLKNEDIGCLFTKYALVDKRDQALVDGTIQKILQAKEEIRKWKHPTTIIEKIAYNNMVRDWEVKF